MGCVNQVYVTGLVSPRMSCRKCYVVILEVRAIEQMCGRAPRD
jgi:hypothetical protein